MIADDFERAALFRRKLAQRLGLPDGKDPENVGIALGPDDRLLVTMPVDVAEKLLEPAESEAVTTIARSPGERFEFALRIGEGLLSRIGHRTMLVRKDLPPVTGVVAEIEHAVAGDEFGAGVVRVETDEAGRVAVPLEEILEVRVP